VGTFALRPATESDANAIARIHLAARQSAMPWLPAVHTEEEVRWFFAERVMRDCAVCVAEGSEVLGFCAFRDGWVDHLYVDPRAQGAGVGSALLAKAMTGQSSLHLWVFQRNQRAIRFYEAHGFRLVVQTDGRRNEEKEPDALYDWVAGRD